MEQRRTRRLVRRAARGDHEAFTALYEAYADRVFGFVRLRCDDLRDAEEVTETVFMKAWQGLPAYRHRGAPFPAWLFAIARNEIVDEARRARRRPPTADEEFAHDAPASNHVEEQVLRNADGARVRAALSELTEEQEAVIVSRFFWNFSLSETAAALDKSVGATKALQHRALSRLATVLDEEDDRVE